MVTEKSIIPGVKATIKIVMRDMTTMGSNVFEGLVHRTHECLSTTLNRNQGR